MRRARWVLTAIAVTALTLGIGTHRHELADATHRLVTLSPGWAAALAVVAVLGIVTDGAFASTLTPGLSVRRATMVQQAATASNNTIVGSGPVATGLRIAMLRTWGVPDGTVGLTIAALNLVASYSVWIVGLGAAVVGATGAAGDLVDRRLHAAVIVIAVAVLSVSTALWWALLHRPAIAHRLARAGQRPIDAARRRVRRLPAVDLASVAERFRVDARQLARVHGVRIVIAAAVEQAVNLVTPLVAVRAFGIRADVVSASEIVVAYGLVRLGAALTPLPGGIGVTEAGLAALLVRAGGPTSDVVAAVLAYRAITFLLPLFAGSVSFAAWRFAGAGRWRLGRAPGEALSAPGR